MMKQRQYLILFFFLVVFISARATPWFITEHYTTEHGLANNTVYCTLKGNDGFIWMGTRYGLCSFDGTKFKIYNNRDGIYSDIPPRKIHEMAEDKNGFLWIKTIDGKLYTFDKRQERFYVIYDDVKQYTENIQIINIQNTADKDVLLLTKDKKLFRACTINNGRVIEIQQLYESSPEGEDKRFQNSKFVETNYHINWLDTDYKILSLRKGEELTNKPFDYIFAQTGLPSAGSFTCAFENAGRLWLGDNTGKIYNIDPKAGTVEKHQLPFVFGAVQNLLITDGGIAYISIVGQGTHEYQLADRKLQRLYSGPNANNVLRTFVDKYNKVWFEESQALFYYDPLSKSGKRFPLPEGKPIGKSEVQDTGDSGMFFLTRTGELLMFDRETLSMVHLNRMKPFSDIQTGEPLFSDLYLDDTGILWLSSHSAGVYRLYFPKKQFKLLDPQTFKAIRLESDITVPEIEALYQTRNGDIWMGASGSGLYHFDKDRRLKRNFSTYNYQVGEVRHIMEDNNGNLWFSTKKNGLVKASPDEKAPYGFRFIRYTNNPQDLSSISSNNISFTFQDSKGRIWVGLLEGGLNLLYEVTPGQTSFKHKFNGFKQYPFYGLYMEVCNMAEDDKGRLWVGTTDGLMSFDANFDLPENIVFETYRNRNSDAKDIDNVTDNDIKLLYKDSDAQIWVGVFGGGLNRLIGYDEEAQRPIFQTYGTREGLNNDMVNSIVEDDNKNLWFITEKGISRLDKQTGLFRNYDKYDGVPDMISGASTALKTLTGEIWLGGSRGILEFSPDKLVDYDCNHTTYIVDFNVPGKDIRHLKNEADKYMNKLRLPYNPAGFTIEFAALNFCDPQKISYKYILEGYEKEWRFNGKNRIANYTNVPPGKYTFRVQSIGEGSSEQTFEKALKINIFTPWHQSRAAYIFYILIAIGLAAIARKFFPELLTKIKSLRKTSNEKTLPLHISRINLNDMMESFYKEFRILSEKNEVGCSFCLTNEVIMIRADEVKLDTAIRNIILYAFKHTLSGKNITVSTGTVRNGKHCFIRIENDDIPRKKTTGALSRKIMTRLNSIFRKENFWKFGFEANSDELAYSKELIYIHKGSVEAERHENQWTAITVKLLTDNEEAEEVEVVEETGKNIKANEEDPIEDTVSSFGLNRMTFAKKIKSLIGRTPKKLIKKISKSLKRTG